MGLWRAWLAGQDDSGLLAPLEYRNQAGERFQRSHAEILAHLVNHGTHHRGQVTAAMSALGLETPVLDLLYYTPKQP